MQFKAFWLGMEPTEREQFAMRCGVSPAYLDHVSTGYRKASVGKLAPRIEQESQGQVTRQELRPDVFGPSPQARAA